MSIIVKNPSARGFSLISVTLLWSYKKVIDLSWTLDCEMINFDWAVELKYKMGKQSETVDLSHWFVFH